ncbi:hypothetical protein ACFQNF_15670 [Iodobacter arcticus]|uniref:Uncharacterized protein n=1 Tax=Iodobacter arcticus TaxID=590593 RepID=A0ABW2R060_9NEIS
MIKLLMSSRWYLWFSFGLLIINIGSGLTAVAVFKVVKPKQVMEEILT